MRRLCCLAAVSLAVVAFVGTSETAASAAHPQLHRGCTNALLGHYLAGRELFASGASSSTVREQFLERNRFGVGVRG